MDIVGCDPRLPSWPRCWSCVRDDRYVALCAIYSLAAVLVGVAFSGGAGVDMNVWFDAAIALAMGAALAVDRFEQPLHKALVALAYAVPLLCGLALAYDGEWLERDFWLHPAREDAAMAAADIGFLKAHDGPVLCEMLSLCYWAGKRAEVDVFNLGQAYATHARSDDSRWCGWSTPATSAQWNSTRWTNSRSVRA